MEGKLCWGRTNAIVTIFDRYEECGLEGLSDRPRLPFRYANRLPELIEAAIAVRGKSPGL